MKNILGVIALSSTLIMGCASTQSRVPNQVSIDVGRIATPEDFDAAAKESGLSEQTIDQIKQEITRTTERAVMLKALEADPANKMDSQFLLGGEKSLAHIFALSWSVNESKHVSGLFRSREKVEAIIEQRMQNAIKLYQMGTGLSFGDMGHIMPQEPKLTPAFEAAAKKSNLSSDSISYLRKSVLSEESSEKLMDELLAKGEVSQEFYNDHMKGLASLRSGVFAVIAVIEQSHTSRLLKTEKGFADAVGRKVENAAKLYELGKQK